MERHFVRELEDLKSTIIRMGSIVEDAVSDALRALQERDTPLARQVILREPQVNALEIEIDNRIVDFLALHQPVASDLRFLLAALKINNDLERIGDHAVNIAESAISSGGRPAVAINVDLPTMGQIAVRMLKDALDGFIHTDAAMGRGVLKADDIVDDLNRKIVIELTQIIRSDRNAVEAALDLARVSRNLERVADLATNIAEEVIFIAESQIVKHQPEKILPRT